MSEFLGTLVAAERFNLGVDGNQVSLEGMSLGKIFLTSGTMIEFHFSTVNVFVV